MDFQSLTDSIVLEVAELESEYQACPGMILTEDDLKCHLFSRLKSKVPMYERTINAGIIGSSLHSEVKFFDEDEKLTLIPDLCVINPMHMSIFHSVEFEVNRKTARFKSYSSKKFEVGGSAILIELKFCRESKGLTDLDIQAYKFDLDKIVRLQKIVEKRSGGRDKIFGVFVLFNKTNTGKDKFENLVANYSHQSDLFPFYGTGNVDFTGINPNLYDTGYLTIDDAIS